MIKTISALAVLGAAAGATLLGGTAAHADPDAPGCTVRAASADHVAGRVLVDLTCDEPRDVLVDATAWHGDADDHQPVDARSASRRVGAGERWQVELAFATETEPSTDMISAQVLSWVDQGDIRERPAILARISG